MQTAAKTYVRITLSALFIALMAFSAQILHDRELIFPEAGALCTGLWVADKRVWNVSRWQIPLLFTIAAIIGVCIVRFLPGGLSIRMEAAFLAAALMLKLSKTSITPLLSACMLPQITMASSWDYPLAVCIYTLIFSSGQYLMERKGLKEITPMKENKSNASVLVWIKLMLFMLPVLISADVFNIVYLAVPPLVVTFAEFAFARSGFTKRPFNIWLTIVLCTVSGTLTEGFLHRILNIDASICAFLTLGIVLVCFNKRKQYFAPAAAMACVPMIVPDEALWYFPLYAAVSSAYFIIVAKIFFSQKDATEDRNAE